MYLSLPKEQSNTNLPLDRRNFLANIRLNSKIVTSRIPLKMLPIFEKIPRASRTNGGGNKPIAIPLAYARHATNCEILELERKKKKGRKKNNIDSCFTSVL